MRSAFRIGFSANLINIYLGSAIIINLIKIILNIILIRFIGKILTIALTCTFIIFFINIMGVNIKIFLIFPIILKTFVSRAGYFNRCFVICI